MVGYQKHPDMGYLWRTFDILLAPGASSQDRCLEVGMLLERITFLEILSHVPNLITCKESTPLSASMDAEVLLNV